MGEVWLLISVRLLNTGPKCLSDYTYKIPGTPFLVRRCQSLGHDHQYYSRGKLYISNARDKPLHQYYTYKIPNSFVYRLVNRLLRIELNVFRFWAETLLVWWIAKFWWPEAGCWSGYIFVEHPVLFLFRVHIYIMYGMKPIHYIVGLHYVSHCITLLSSLHYITFLTLLSSLHYALHYILHILPNTCLVLGGKVIGPGLTPLVLGWGGGGG